MGRKLLTLSDLYDFYCKQNKSVVFNSANEDTEIVVQVDGSISFEKIDNTNGLMPVVLQACHTGKNLNQSSITDKVMKAALPSFANRPILGFIHEVDGQPEFYSHNMHEDDDGDLVYDEFPVGVIPESCKAKIEYDKDKDKRYVVVNGYIYEEYSKAADILRREGECSVSVELSVDQLSYDANDKTLVIEAFTFSGVTILGKDEDGVDVNPGMAGSNIQIADFSKENNSLIEQIKALNERLDAFNINLEEGGKNAEMNKFEELLEKYGKTAEDIDFEYEGMSDEELEEAFSKAFDEEADLNSEDEPESDNEEFEDDSDGEDENEDEVEEEEDEESDSYEIKYSVNDKEFAVSLNDKIYALQTLVNDTYSETDGAYYSVIVYEKDLVMLDMWAGLSYRQSYKERSGVFSLVGDRVAVHAVYVTDDEEKKLNNMKYDHEKLAHYEDEPKKMEILESDDYSLIFDNEEFIDLKKQENHFELTVDEVTQKADAILTQAAKSHKFSVESGDDKEKKIGVKPLPVQPKKKKTKRYGSIFDGIVK